MRDLENDRPRVCIREGLSSPSESDQSIVVASSQQSGPFTGVSGWIVGALVGGVPRGAPQCFFHVNSHSLYR